ncbi:MAG: hypothetical protein KAX26_02535, partial [Anaerolineae bacterium]|nr:hypothetical protein [Anaerolineae bacterium]
DKPRLFLEESDFEQEDDNAFYVARSEGGWAIRRREGGRESYLAVEGDTGEMDFENDLLRISLAPDFQIKSLELKEEFEGLFSLAEAAEMAVLLKGVTTSLPFLPV